MRPGNVFWVHKIGAGFYTTHYTNWYEFYIICWKNHCRDVFVGLFMHNTAHITDNGNYGNYGGLLCVLCVRIAILAI
jgi:hypothetical protein